MPQRRRFAKNADGVRHFKLVARSMNDAHAEDEDATPLVLEPFVPPSRGRRCGLSEEELLHIPESLQVLGPEVFGLENPQARAAQEEQREERRRQLQEEGEEDLDAELDKDCYFPKDGYNYEQHLARVSGGKKGGVVGVVLEPPKEAIETVPDAKAMNLQPATTEEEAELLKALDDADAYEEMEDEEFEDMLQSEDVEMDMVLWGPKAAEYKDMPDLASLKAEYQQKLAARARGGPRIARDGSEEEDEDEYDEEGDEDECQENLENDENFDRFLACEYGDEEIGELQEEDIEGCVTLENVEDVIDEYIQDRDEENKMLTSIYEPQRSGRLDDVPRVIDETKAIIERHYAEGECEDDETSEGDSSEDESKNWDCETVLSTLSNLSNRPGKIGRIKVIKKPVAPTLKPVKEGEVQNEDEEDAEEDDVVDLPDVINERPKGETPEERKARKASVKEMRRVCRKMKKESKELYKAEAAKLPGQQRRNADVRPKTRVIPM